MGASVESVVGAGDLISRLLVQLVSSAFLESGGRGQRLASSCCRRTLEDCRRQEVLRDLVAVRVIGRPVAGPCG